jgi:hypothetical protein
MDKTYQQSFKYITQNNSETNPYVWIGNLAYKYEGYEESGNLKNEIPEITLWLQKGPLT